MGEPLAPFRIAVDLSIEKSGGFIATSITVRPAPVSAMATCLIWDPVIGSVIITGILGTLALVGVFLLLVFLTLSVLELLFSSEDIRTMLTLAVLLC